MNVEITLLLFGGETVYFVNTIFVERTKNIICDINI